VACRYRQNKVNQREHMSIGEPPANKPNSSRGRCCAIKDVERSLLTSSYTRPLNCQLPVGKRETFAVRVREPGVRPLPRKADSGPTVNLRICWKICWQARLPLARGALCIPPPERPKRRSRRKRRDTKTHGHDTKTTLLTVIDAITCERYQPSD